MLGLVTQTCKHTGRCRTQQAEAGGFQVHGQVQVFARHKILSENKQNKCTLKTFPLFPFQAPSYFYNNWLSLKWRANVFMSTDKFLFCLSSLTGLVEPSTTAWFTNINYPIGQQWSSVCSEPEGTVFVGLGFSGEAPTLICLRDLP